MGRNPVGMAATRKESRMSMHHRYGTVAIQTDVLDIVRGMTACSSKVFYGLLAWANLNAHNSSSAEQREVTRHSESFKIFREMVP